MKQKNDKKALVQARVSANAVKRLKLAQINIAEVIRIAINEAAAQL